MVKYIKGIFEKLLIVPYFTGKNVYLYLSQSVFDIQSNKTLKVL